MAPGLSEAEMKILALAWQCFDVAPQIDFEKLSKLCGHTNPKSTRNTVAAIKKKLAAMAEEAGGDSNVDATPTPTKTSVKATAVKALKAKVAPKTEANGGKKRKASTPADGLIKDEDESESEAPAIKSPERKRARGRPAKAKTADSIAEVDGDDAV